MYFSYFQRLLDWKLMCVICGQSGLLSGWLKASCFLLTEADTLTNCQHLHLVINNIKAYYLTPISWYHTHTRPPAHIHIFNVWNWLTWNKRAWTNTHCKTPPSCLRTWSLWERKRTQNRGGEEILCIYLFNTLSISSCRSCLSPGG